MASRVAQTRVVVAAIKSFLAAVAVESFVAVAFEVVFVDFIAFRVAWA